MQAPPVRAPLPGAVDSGALSEEELDVVAARNAALALAAQAAAARHASAPPADKATLLEAHHAFARRAAAEAGTAGRT